MAKKFLSPIRFECCDKSGKKFEHWSGIITRMINHGSHYEIYIESRSGFIFIVGKYVNGGFISIPAFNVGSDLAGYGDYFWNKERLVSLMNRVDAITVAEALRTLGNNNFL